MSWIDHSRFRSTRDAVIRSIKRAEYSFRKLKPIIFLCGGANSPRRQHLRRFLQKQKPETLVFYADNVWQLIASSTTLDALVMERELAALSDVVIIVVESPGTFAELGAFALYPPLCKKLLPLVDRRFEHADSFINVGPIRAVNEKSTFAPVIWANFELILEAGSDLLQRLENLPRSDSTHVPKLAESEKHLLFFLCDLLAVFGPCSAQDLSFYCERIVGTVEVDRISRLIALAHEMNLVISLTLTGKAYYARPLKSNEYPSFQETEYLSLPNQRATIISVMLQIPEATAALEAVSERL